MPSPFLAVRANSGGTAQLYSYSGATPIAVGTAAGGVQAYGTGTTYRDNAANIAGKLFYLSYTDLHESRDDGYTWSSVLSLSQAPFSASNLTLIPVTQPDGSVIWCGLYYVVGNAYVIRSYDLGATWSNTAIGAGVITDLVTSYRGRVVFQSGTSTILLTINGSISLEGAADSKGPYVTWNGLLYGITRLSGVLSLRNIAGSTVTQEAVIDNTQTYADSNILTAAWVDPDTNNLIVLARGNTDWKTFEIDGSFTVTERTSTMLTGGTLAGYSTSAKIGGVLVDQIDAVGSASSISVYVASNSAAGTSLNQYIYNGVGSLLGDGSGNPNDTGGNIVDTIPYLNIDSLRNWTPRALEATETTGTPYAGTIGLGSPIINGMRVQFSAVVPRTAPLATIGGSPATYDLATTPIPSTPIKPGSVAIHGTISGTVEVALDDGAGVFPASTLLPSGGTINYSTGAMTGTTATLDANTDVRAYWSGGTASVQFFRTLATDSYPADVITNAVNPAPLSNPTEGSISGVTNVNVPADGTTCQVDIDMTGFSSGDMVSIEPYVF